MYLSKDEVMGSLDLHQSLQKLEDSIRSFSSGRDLTVSWSDSVRLVIEDFPQDIDVHSSMPEKQDGDKADSIGALEGELILLKAAYALSNVNRRLSLNKLLDLQGNIRVFCRVRPYLPCESQPQTPPLEIVAANEIRAACHGETSKTFKFDKVLPPTSSQENVFMEVQPILKTALDGQNVCIFAYGQTGTGKTYTMEGSKASPGVIPRALHQLFKDSSLETNARYRFSLSMLEIYKGSLRDLLVPRPTRILDPPAKSLNIHMSVSEYVEVENLTEYVIENAADALKFYRKGSRARSTSTTSSNENSSRSHCLVRINMVRNFEESKGKQSVSKLWLIDLGGSERFFKTQAWGKPLEEGKAINVSLTALGDVISALQKKLPHIPYRNSKLTQLLRDSLGSNSKVLMFVHPSPKEEDFAETICSLTFASRARGIHLTRDTPSKIQEKQALVASILGKMQAFEGECHRLRCDIRALESAIKEKKGISAEKAEDKFVLLEHNDKGGKAETLPRFMTPTISSLYKNRLILGEYEPVWPSSPTVSDKKMSKGILSSMTKAGRLPSSNLGSPQLSIDCGKKMTKKDDRKQQQEASSRRRSTGGVHALLTPIAGRLLNQKIEGLDQDNSSSPKGGHDSASKTQHSHLRSTGGVHVLLTPIAGRLLNQKGEGLEQDNSSSPKRGHHSASKTQHSHLRSASFNHKEEFEQQQPRNMARIQRRLTLECSSRMLMHI